MRWISTLPAVFMVACQPFAPVAPSDQHFAAGQCLLYAMGQCGGFHHCERDLTTRCLAELGWARQPEGWVRVRTDSDLAREIERASRESTRSGD